VALFLLAVRDYEVGLLLAKFVEEEGKQTIGLPGRNAGTFKVRKYPNISLSFWADREPDVPHVLLCHEPMLMISKPSLAVWTSLSWMMMILFEPFVKSKKMNRNSTC